MRRCWKTEETETEKKEHISKTFSHACPSRTSLGNHLFHEASQAELSALPQALKALLQNAHHCSLACLSPLKGLTPKEGRKEGKKAGRKI